MPSFRAAIYAHRVEDVETNITIDAKNKTEARKKLETMIAEDQIPCYKFISCDYTTIADAHIGEIDKID